VGYAERAGVNHLIAARFPWICAIWIHLLVFAVLANQAGLDLNAPPVDPISVEIFVEPASPPPQAPAPSPSGAFETDNAPLSSPENGQLAALPPGTVQPETTELPESGSPQDATPENAPSWVTATGYYASDVLSDPRSAEAREALTTLTGTDRVEQLCALEAMEQVRHSRSGFRPTRLVPHALRNSFQRENAVFAPAGALRSNRVWYEIAYKCRLDTGRSKIIGFEYALGAPIDRSLWDELGLAPVY